MLHVYEAEVLKRNPVHGKWFKMMCRDLTARTKNRYGVIR